MSLVVVRAPLDLPTAHGRRRLSAIQCLDLRRFVDAERQSTVGRVEVKTNDIAHLVDKQRIGRQLEELASTPLQREHLPNAVHVGGQPADIAIDRVLEWVAADGMVSSVTVTTPVIL